MTDTTYQPYHRTAYRRRSWSYDLVKALALSVGLEIDEFIEAVDAGAVVVTAKAADTKEK